MKYLLYTFLFLIPSFSFCQTGPGGVGGPINNVLWLQGSKGVFSDGGITLAASGEDVQQWNDQSGNSKDAIQSVAEYRPNYQSGVLNGFPAIRFTATNADRLLSTTVSTGNAASVWVVAQYSSLTTGRSGIIQAAPAGLAFSGDEFDKVIGLWVESTDSRAGGQGVQSDLTVKSLSQTTTLSANTSYLFNNLYDGNSSINQFINGGTAGSVSYDGTLSDWSDFGIGAQGTESWNGDIAEVIVYASALNDTQKVIIDNYLSAKYDIPLNAHDYYSQDNTINGDYDFDVAGIGQLISSSAHADAQGGMVRILNPLGLTINDTEFYLWGHDNAPARASNTTDIPTGEEGVEARLERVWRGSESGTILEFDIRFDLSGLGPVTPSDLRLLIDTNNNGAFDDETSLGGGVVKGATLVGDNVYEFSSVTSLNNDIRFTLGTINKSQTPMPVELVRFNAIQDGRKVKLEWTTASEKNNDYFTIERSLDGKSWEGLRKIYGAGNSSSDLHYVGWDDSPSFGLIYYRLKQTDFDGSFTYSSIEIVHFQYEEKIKIYPNPVRNQLHVEWNMIEKPGIVLETFLGQIIDLRPLVSSNNKIVFNTSYLAKGVYLLKIIAGSRIQTKKVIIN